MGDPAADALPRLLVVSDIPVERKGGGGLVLYRLLNQYPAGRLFVLARPHKDWGYAFDRVPGAEYQELPYTIPRLIFNRFDPFWPVVMSRYIRRLVPAILAAAARARPDAVLGVAHDFLWFAAAAAAARLRLPFHLILHDDWPALQTVSQIHWTRPAARWACRRVYGAALRRATVRYSISPGMAERYAAWYGVGSEVLYPSRGEDSPTPAVRVSAARPEPFVLAYAGMIHQAWAVESLRAAAAAVAGLGGRLDLYVPYPDEVLAKMGLTGPAVRNVGFFPAHEMADRVARTAHALYLPASFGAAERVDVSTLFPSKMADYTAIGLPVVVWGPGYSSAARWAADNPGAAELVTDPDPAHLAAALVRLADPDHARKVAAAGVAAGLRDFDVYAVRRRFHTVLLRHHR